MSIKSRINGKSLINITCFVDLASYESYSTVIYNTILSKEGGGGVACG